MLRHGEEKKQNSPSQGVAQRHLKVLGLELASRDDAEQKKSKQRGPAETQERRGS